MGFNWYEPSVAVTTCSQAAAALTLLRENKDGFHLVLSDVHMPDIDGFRLLECVGLEMDLPVISKFLMSTTCNKQTHGSWGQTKIQFCLNCVSFLGKKQVNQAARLTVICDFYNFIIR